MKKNNIYIIFSLTGLVIVLWQLLASGYVLTLDMVFGPQVNLTIAEGSLISSLPLKYGLAFITLIFNGWIAQKILLITIFFLLFYFPLRYFKKIFNIENSYGAEYVTSLFFAINPFVYERFLAGQWNVILGYIMLMPITAYLVQFGQESNWKNTLRLIVSIIILGIVSLHILIMTLIIMPVVILVKLIYTKGNLAFLKQSIFLASGILVGSSYWLIPAILSHGTVITTFGPEHWEVFKTAGGSGLGALGNVLTLHGFWGEHEQWISRFVLPKEGGWVFGLVLALILSLVVAGMYAGFKDRLLRSRTIFIIGIMFLAVVFSCGIGEGIFKNFNLWLFEYISFWKGFRDSEKWSAVLALGYALFAGLGSNLIFCYFQKKEYRRIALYILMAISLLYTPMMLFGFVGQLKTVQYPNSWGEVNSVLKQDKNCRALFLPWQQYYSLRFNNDILTANLSSNYFDCDIVQGKNMNLGDIVSQGGNGEEYDLIEKAVMDNLANQNSTIDFLKKKGIKYIIFTDDVVGEDPYQYPFLTSRHLFRVINREGICLYRLI